MRDPRDPRERERTRDTPDSFFWARLITILCILGGCLLFGGQPPEVRVPKSPTPMLASVDSCAATLSFPRIALLFLIKGPLYHSEMWESWLEGAAGVLPAEYLSRKICAGGGEDEIASPSYVKDACDRSRQHLFSVYVHMSKELDVDELLDPQWSLHAKNVTRVVTKWGHHSLVEATRNLLEEAFKDPANQRFLLLSETHIPLWDPLTVYRVAMNEQRSSINAYFHDNMDTQRWTKKMAPVVPKENWRKNQQWWTLVRSHVDLILRDSEIVRVFQEHCIFEMEFNADKIYHRKCFSDEHYFATYVTVVTIVAIVPSSRLPTMLTDSISLRTRCRLLSIKGVEDETIPFFATTTYVEWPAGSAHPKSFLPEEVTRELLRTTLRSHESCPLSSSDQIELLRRSRKSFVDVAELERGNLESICGVAKSYGRYGKQAALPPACTTFARKFGDDTVDAVYSMLEADMVL